MKKPKENDRERRKARFVSNPEDLQMFNNEKEYKQSLTKNKKGKQEPAPKRK